MQIKSPLKKKQAKKTEFTQDGWTRLFLAFVVIGAGFMAYAGGQLGGFFLSDFLLAPFESLAGIQERLAQYLIIQAVIIALLIGIGFSFRAKLSELGLGKIKNWTYFFLLPLIFIATLVLGGIASALVTLAFPEYNAAEEQQLGLPSLGGQGDILLTGLLLVVIVPIVEEFIFRGYLQGLLRRYLPFWLTNLITSALFGIAHLQPNVIINTFILGLALSYVREKTNSIWTGVALHSLKNLVAFLLLFVFNIV